MRISDWSSDLCSSDRPGVTQWQKANTPLQENADQQRAIHTGSAPAAGKGAGTRPEELRTARRAEGPPAVQTPVDKTAGRGAQPVKNQQERSPRAMKVVGTSAHFRSATSRPLPAKSPPYRARPRAQMPEAPTTYPPTTQN